MCCAIKLYQTLNQIFFSPRRAAEEKLRAAERFNNFTLLLTLFPLRLSVSCILIYIFTSFL